jgi:hypothetical protein
MSSHFVLPARPLRRPIPGLLRKFGGPAVAAALVLGAGLLGAQPAQAAAEPSGANYQGYQFAKKWVCLESNIRNAPLATVAAMYRVQGIKVSVRFALGQCAAAGFARSQYVPITAYQADDNMCAGTPTTHANGYIVQAAIIINLQPDTKASDGSTRYYSTCRSGAEWTDMFAHELGHAFGLSHEQSASTSIMRDGHTTSTADRNLLGLIYANNPA